MPRSNLKRNRDGSEKLDTSKPTAVFKPTEGRDTTLSVALPASIIANAQNHELKTSMAGTIARALAVFSVDEVVVFSDTPPSMSSTDITPSDTTAYTGYSDPTHFLIHLLSYLEMPPYLRRALFPLHPNLKTAGTLPSTDMPHHLRADEWCTYREGVTLESPKTNGAVAEQRKGWKKDKKKDKPRPFDDVDVEDGVGEKGTLVDAGLQVQVKVPVQIPPHSRVTLKFPSSMTIGPRIGSVPILAKAVAPSAPREEQGYYWGYFVRRAESLSAVFAECPFEGGYSFSVGTSERGKDVEDVVGGLKADLKAGDREPGKHLMVVFGGVAGLEAAVDADPELQKMGVAGPEELFDAWVNVVPDQGSRTIRTEEAVWVALMGLRGLVQANTSIKDTS